MLLSSLTPDEIERLSFVAPGTPGIARAAAVICHAELAIAQKDIARLEKQVTDLEDWTPDENP